MSTISITRTLNTKVELTPDQRAECIRWAEELESGRRMQTDGALRKMDDGKGGKGSGTCSFCCLGVYGDIGGGPTSPTIWQPGMDGPDDAPFIDDQQVGSIGGDEYLRGDWFEKKTGMTTDHQILLAEKNDSGFRFRAIAGAIRYFAEHGKLPGSAYWEAVDWDHDAI